MSILNGWPDVLRCGIDNGAGKDALFYLHSASESSGAMRYYVQPYFFEDRTVTFNNYGVFVRRVGHDGSSIGCAGKTILQLYREDRAYNLVKSKQQDPSGLTTMSKSWPDIIACGGGENGFGAILVLVSMSGGGIYTQIYKYEDRYIRFDSLGAYLTAEGHTSSTIGCIYKNISQLYNEGRAFNIVTSKTADFFSLKTMISGWPDALACASGNGLGAILFFAGGAWYTQPYYYEDRYIRFDLYGNYLDSAGHLSTTRGCIGKTISQLYNEGRAFNFLTNKELEQNFLSTSTSLSSSPAPSSLHSPSPIASPRDLPSVDVSNDSQVGKSFWESNGGITIISVMSVLTGIATIVSTGIAIHKCCRTCHQDTVVPSPPIGITLEEGKEISLISFEQSKTYFDYEDDGKIEKTSWVSGDDTILVYDHNNNGTVDNAKEIVLSHWCPRL